MNLSLPVLNYCTLCAAPVEVVQHGGRLRPVCTHCGNVIYVNPFPAACLVVLREGQALLTLRGIEPRQGEWCLPGGFLEWGESPEEGAGRELLEETGITADGLSLIGAYHSITGERRHVLLLAYRALGWSGEPTAGDDAAEVRWFDLDSLPPLAFKAHEQVVADVRKAGCSDENSRG
jgi:8-oxo-dGTP diphosphatase